MISYKMKVVQINAVYEYSSTGRTTTEMHEYLCEKGIDSYVFCTNYSNSKKNVFKFSSGLDMKIHSVLSRILGMQGMFSYFSTKKLLAKLEQIKPDVVHLRVLHSNCINLPLLLRYLAKHNIATVLTLHDCWYFTGHCCYFVDSKCCKWKTGCGGCPDLKNWNKSLFFDNSAKLLALKKELFGNIKNLAVVGVSDWVTDFIKDSILKDAKIVKRIYNWIDIPKFTPRDTKAIRESIGFDDKDFVVLGVAQIWSPSKGLDSFIKLAKQCPDIKIAIVGKVLQTDLPANIILLGVVSDTQKLIDYYSMADVFFNPSLRETFGKVTIEAMAAGTPAIVYRATASPELIKDGCGHIVEINDINSVVNVLQEIENKGKGYYSENCRAYVFEAFNRNVLMGKYLSLYNQIISRN